MDKRQSNLQNETWTHLGPYSDSDKYSSLLGHMQQGFCIIEVLFDGAKDPIDYRILEVNAAFEKQTGLSSAAGKTMRELQPAHEQHWFDIYGQVAKTQQPVHFEQEAAHLAGGAWYDVFAFPFGPAESNLLAILFNNVTSRITSAAENAKIQHALAESQGRALIQKEALIAAINDEPLAKCLNILSRMVKNALGDDVRTAFYLAYPDGTSLHAIEGAGDMSTKYTDALDGFPVGETSFCSGYAIATGQASHTRDVYKDPQWQPYLDLVEAHDFRSSSSYPILTPKGKAIGSLAIYFRQVHEPTALDRSVAEAVTHSAAIILSRHVQARQRLQKEERMRRSEEHQAFLLELSDTLSLLDSPAEIAKLVSERLCEHLGASRVHYAEITGDILHVRQDFIRGVPSMIGEHSLSVYGPGFLSAYKPGAVIRSDNIENDPRLGTPARATLRENQVASFADAVLFEENGQITMLAVQSTTPREWASEEALIRGVADRTKSAIKRARAEQALRRSEEQQRFILESAKEYAIITLDLDRCVTSWNAGAAAMMGYADPDIIGQLGDVLFTPEDRAKGGPENEMRKAMQAGRAENERWHVRQDGSRFYGSGVTQPLRNEAGTPVGYVKIMRDLTFEKQAEEALRQSEQRIRLAAEAARMATWEWDLVKDQVYWNEQHFKLFDMPVQPNPLPSSAFTQHLHPDDAESIKMQLSETIEHRTPYDAEFRIIREDGQTRWMSGYGRVTGQENGRSSRASGVMIDVTDRKLAEEAIRESEARLSALFEGLPVGAGVFNMSGKMVVSNQAMLHYLPNGRIPSADTEFRHRWKAFDADDRLLETKDYPGAKALRGERVVPGIEMLYTGEDGQQKWTRVAAVPVGGKGDR